MKNIHVVIDFMHIYYRHHYQLIASAKKKAEKEAEAAAKGKAGAVEKVEKVRIISTLAQKERQKEKQLAVVIDGVEVDTTMSYLVIKSIEAIRKQYSNEETTCLMDICFDSKTDRTEIDATYKVNRVDKLPDSAYDDIDNIRDMLDEAGFNVYKEEGKEADDIVTSLATNFKDKFDYTVIYTNDKDLLVNVCDKVGVMRYKTFDRKYIPIAVANYEAVISREFKSERVPYNSVLLYLSTVGDKVDNIVGIYGFGVKAFDAVIAGLTERGYSFLDFHKKEVVAKVIEDNKDLFANKKDSERYKSALESLNLAAPDYLDIPEPVKRDTEETRSKLYAKYSFNSLLKK